MTNYSRTLTEEEHTVLEQMMLARRFPYIARDMAMSQSKVRRIACQIYDKLGAGNRVEAVMFVIDMGILDQFTFWGS